MSSSFIKKVVYKKERVGVVEKDGKIYVKYVKQRRFRISKNSQYIILGILILAVFGLAVKLMLYELELRTPVEDAAQTGD